MSGRCREILLRANAKLNLTLDIVGVRPQDGYHLMDMVNCSVSLSDELSIRRTETPGIRLRSNARYLPLGEKNLVYKAAMRFSETTGLALPGLEFSIRKHIPTQAGLGGGSADAAAALIGLNELLGAGLSAGELCGIGERIGADVPYCVVGGFARVGGIGEILQPVPCAASFALVILMPGKGKSTREAFAAFDRGGAFCHPETEKMLAALAAGRTDEVARYVRNAFSELDKSETTAHLERELRAAGALGAAMTGSGAAVFGVFPDAATAERARNQLRAREYSAFAAVPCDRGVEILKKTE